MIHRRHLIAGSLALIAAPARAADFGQALSEAFGRPADALGALDRALKGIRVASARADVLLRAQGLAQGRVAERLSTLRKDERYLYAADDAGRDRAVAEMNARVAALRPKLPIAFGDLPIPRAEARRMSAADVAAGRGGYREPGAYYVDLRNIRARPSWTLPSVAFHEVIPGHLLQMPLSTKPAGAFFEAWAIYAEQLASDLGAYADDPLGEIGYLHWRMFRLARVVADAGLNGLGWSQDHAVEVVRELQGFDAAFVTIEADVARMAREPAKFAADGLGALEIARLRPKDRAAWPAFHKRLLVDGPWPPGQLAQHISK